MLFFVVYEGINWFMLGWVIGGGLVVVYVFEQDFVCINVFDFDMKKEVFNVKFVDIENVMVKCINVMFYNIIKFGMNMMSFEMIFVKVQVFWEIGGK